jgi:signal transduction histidine kinase/ActR/RegA family two-component response regulator
MNHSTTYRTTWLVWLLAGIGLSAGTVTLVIVGAALWNVMGAKERQDVLHDEISRVVDEARRNKQRCDADLRRLLADRSRYTAAHLCRPLVLDAATVAALHAADPKVGQALTHVQEGAAKLPALYAACHTWADDNVQSRRELQATRQRAETALFQLRDHLDHQAAPSTQTEKRLVHALELQLVFERLLRAETAAELVAVQDDQLAPLAVEAACDQVGEAEGQADPMAELRLAQALHALAGCDLTIVGRQGALDCGPDGLLAQLSKRHDLSTRHDQLEMQAEQDLATLHAATDVLREAELHFTRRAAAETGQVLHRAWRAILLTAALALGFFLGIAWKLPRAVSAQLEAVNSAAREIELARRKLKAQNIALDQAQKRAEVASQGKSEFLAMVSHEFRTPLTSVLGYCDILLTRPLPGDACESVLTIQRNGQHLLSVVSDILDLSKIESGRLDVQTGACSLVGIVRDAADLLAPRARAKRLTLATHPVGRLPAVVQADATRLRQIAINLLATAVELAESGEISLAAQCRTTPMPNWTLSIAAPGMVLSEQQIERLFEPFVNSVAVKGRGQGDMGLGLSISRRLATLLGGEIRVTSDAERGTTLELTTPIELVDDAPLVDGMEAMASVAASSDIPQIPASADQLVPPRPIAPVAPLDTPLRILVAEDGPDNQRLIATVLKRLGAEIEIVSNGSQAVELALNASRTGCPYSVILMDMQMPVLDGYAATRRLRDEGYDGPIIALTAHAMAHDRQKCLDAGCTDYSTKPLQIPMLQSMVRHYAAAGQLTA